MKFKKVRPKDIASYINMPWTYSVINIKDKFTLTINEWPELTAESADIATAAINMQRKLKANISHNLKRSQKFNIPIIEPGCD